MLGCPDNLGERLPISGAHLTAAKDTDGLAVDLDRAALVLAHFPPPQQAQARSGWPG